MQTIGKVVKLTIDDRITEFAEVKDLAKQKARDLFADPMLLSWYIGKTGEGYPNLECGREDKPAWVVYAESRGCDLTVDVNDGAYLFYYLSSIDK